MEGQIQEETDARRLQTAYDPKKNIVTEVILVLVLCCSLEALVKNANNALLLWKNLENPNGRIFFAISCGTHGLLVFYIFCVGILFFLNAFQGLKKKVLRTSNDHSGTKENVTDNLGTSNEQIKDQTDPFDIGLLVRPCPALWRLLSISAVMFAFCIGVYMAVTDTRDILRCISILGCSAITLILIRIAYIILQKIATITPETIVNTSNTVKTPEVQYDSIRHQNVSNDTTRHQNVSNDTEMSNLISHVTIMIGIIAFVLIVIYISVLPTRLDYSHVTVLS